METVKWDSIWANTLFIIHWSNLYIGDTTLLSEPRVLKQVNKKSKILVYVSALGT